MLLSLSHLPHAAEKMIKFAVNFIKLNDRRFRR